MIRNHHKDMFLAMQTLQHVKVVFRSWIC